MVHSCGSQRQQPQQQTALAQSYCLAGRDKLQVRAVLSAAVAGIGPALADWQLEMPEPGSIRIAAWTSYLSEPPAVHL